MKKIILLICFATTSCYNVQAQNADSKWNIGFHAGVSEYNGDLGNGFYKFDKSAYGIGAFSISRYLGGHFVLDLAAHKGRIGYEKTPLIFRSSFTSAMLNVRFNFFKPTAAINPYLFVGGGAILFDKDINLKSDNVAKKMDFGAPTYGGGLNIKLGPVLSLNVQETFSYSNSDTRDGIKAGGSNETYLFHTVGLNFNLGKKKDTDKDGVADRLDKCPNTPSGVSVDKNGCPLDRDGDGVADYIDACPDVAGLSKFNGCPDRDGDGISDKDDACPDVAGLLSLKGCPDRDGDGISDADDRCPDASGSRALRGCPDSDGDGVADVDDKCPRTPAGYKVNEKGCPLDNDNDGVLNEDDRCPNVPGSASLKGCPDFDGDGVPDIDDRCPKIKGTIANKGCPEITKEDIVKITKIGSKIFFENNSDKLKVASLVQLDELVTLLNKYEGSKLTIEGHTDNVGKDDFNIILSQKRTESVKKYLEKKGISETRLMATGFGETLPIADNKTALGRAKNRRVELKTSY